jgi:hypothetical protein
MHIHEEEQAMADSKHKGKHQKHETAKPGKGTKDELTDNDLEQASGGGLKIDGVAGESADDQHQSWIEVP